MRQFSIRVVGTRNYTCNSQLVFGPSMALANITGDYTGLLYFTDAFNGITDLRDPATGAFVGLTHFDATVPGAVFVQPAPAPDVDEPWGRLKVSVTGGLPPANYYTRTEARACVGVCGGGGGGGCCCAHSSLPNFSPRRPRAASPPPSAPRRQGSGCACRLRPLRLTTSACEATTIATYYLSRACMHMMRWAVSPPPKAPGSQRTSV